MSASHSRILRAIFWRDLPEEFDLFLDGRGGEDLDQIERLAQVFSVDGVDWLRADGAQDLERRLHAVAFGRLDTLHFEVEVEESRLLSAAALRALDYVFEVAEVLAVRALHFFVAQAIDVLVAQ